MKISNVDSSPKYVQLYSLQALENKTSELKALRDRDEGPPANIPKIKLPIGIPEISPSHQTRQKNKWRRGQPACTKASGIYPTF